MEAKQQDMEKRHFWQKTIREAIRSKLSIREFCRRRRLKESQFYWWQRKLNGKRHPRGRQQRMEGGSRGHPLLTAHGSFAGDHSAPSPRYHQLRKPEIHEGTEKACI